LCFSDHVTIGGNAMPTLRNPRHERFAQLLASGEYATDAYEKAGYSRDAGNASYLAKTEEITNRVQEITAAAFAKERKAAAVAAERAAVTVESLMRECEEAARGAAAAGQWSAVIAAIKEKGVLSGKRVERRESGGPGEVEAIEKMTAAELRAFIASARLLETDAGHLSNVDGRKLH